MGSLKQRRRAPRTRTIECLEQRQVMSADPLGGLFTGGIEHHLLADIPLSQPAFQDESLVESGGQGSEIPQLVMHGVADMPLSQPGFEDELLVGSDGQESKIPELTVHGKRTADFWLDYTQERDLDQMLGDIQQTLASAHELTGLDQVRNDYGFIGTGQTVAIIDSGIAYDHYALGGGLGPNYRVVGGWDFTEEFDADPYDDGPGGSHGTHVAGIVGADRPGTADDGVAPGVDLVSLRVFNDDGAGYFSWVENALQWVHDNRDSFENSVTAVNLSLGTAWNADTVPSWAMLEDEFAQLEADGIFIAVSAGNSFSSYGEPGLSYPAASPYVVPVMSVDDSGDLSSFSQRHVRAIAAPGRHIVSTVPDYAGNNNGVTDDFASFSGTSMAAPYVAGASVLVREAMQFVGYADITQDMIYDHMMATADTFFDAATNQSYQRLNLENAITTLMPEDDFGSSVEDAYNLGTIGSLSIAAAGMSMNGLIGTLTDADYFTFTAGATGTVSFTAATSHDLVAAWSGVGGQGWTSGDSGETYTMDVVAGQTYSVGLSTSDGIGYYDLAIEAEAAFTYADWGTIEQLQANDLAVDGEAWYRVAAGRDGYLTAEAFFAAADGDVAVALYDADLQLVAAGVGAEGGARVDFLAAEGEEFFLHVAGTNADVDFRLTNLISLSGDTATVFGTSEADTFTFTAGDAQHAVNVNGVDYLFDASTVSTIQIDGDAGSDTITMTGTAGDETATLEVGNTTLAGEGYTAVASDVESVTVYGGGGSDTATLHGTDDDDLYRTYADRVVMSGSGYFNRVFGFHETIGYAGLGNDRAQMYDSAGNDLYRTYADRVVMSGNGYYNRATGFDETYGYAFNGGFDQVNMYDSTGNDLFEAGPGSVAMTGPGFRNESRGFDHSYAYAIHGGYDQANLYDSEGNDVLNAGPGSATLLGAGFRNEVRSFDQVFAFAMRGGSDVAHLYDSPGDELYRAYADRGIMEGVGFSNNAVGFGSMYGFSLAGGNDLANMYDSPGDDLYEARLGSAVMTGSNFRSEARGFSEVVAYAIYGGEDRANLYDSAGDDLLNAGPGSATLSGAGFRHEVRNFEETHAFAIHGGFDRANLFDSAADDLLTVRIWGASISGASFHNQAEGFEQINAYFTKGGDDTVDEEAVDYIFNLIGQPL